MTTTLGVGHATTAYPPSLSAIRCAGAIMAVKLSLHMVGLRRTLRAIHRLASPKHATRRVPQELVEQVARRVAVAGAFYPGRVACLEQSLVLYWALLRMRVPVVFRIGVLPSRFAAHAWVEYGGQPVLESELVRTVVPFPSLPL